MKIELLKSKLLIYVVLLFIDLYVLPKQGTSEGRRFLRRLRLKGQRKRQATDHAYALPASPKAVKAKLEQASARVRKLQWEKSNALKREKRAKNNMQALLEELKEKHLTNEELKDKLECYSGKIKILH